MRFLAEEGAIQVNNCYVAVFTRVAHDRALLLSPEYFLLPLALLAQGFYASLLAWHSPPKAIYDDHTVYIEKDKNSNFVEDGSLELSNAVHKF